MMARVGLLALQGGWAPHERALVELGHEPRLVLRPADLIALDGIVLPGGESTTQLRLLERHDLARPLDAFVRAGHPVLATCAGLILAARRVVSPAQQSFGWIDVTVARNAWGRQVHSSEARSDDDRPLVFIRAPRILEVGSAEVLVTLDGEPLLVRSGNAYGATFHPELTDDLRVHEEVFGRGDYAWVSSTASAILH